MQFVSILKAQFSLAYSRNFTVNLDAVLAVLSRGYVYREVLDYS